MAYLDDSFCKCLQEASKPIEGKVVKVNEES